MQQHSRAVLISWPCDFIGLCVHCVQMKPIQIRVQSIRDNVTELRWSIGLASSVEQHAPHSHSSNTNDAPSNACQQYPSLKRRVVLQK
jgi:hypothetical protein|eukprot:COSAG06_NODE_99_length_24156_cov_20.889549_24_plen_88_part_00